MYSKEQKDIALRIYHQTESVTETIRILGYPTRRNLYTQIAEENTPPKTRREYPVIDNPPDHPRNPPLEVKLDAIHRCYELGENICPVTVYQRLATFFQVKIDDLLKYYPNPNNS